MKNVIINADDFGINSSANGAISLLYSAQVLTSATIMVNMGECSAEAIKTAKILEMPVGLHFNLTLNQPKYPTRGAFEKAYLKGKMDKAYILNELTSQYIVLTSQGINPTHIDSHQHIHNWPGVFKIVADFAKAQGVPLRIPEELPILNPYDKLKLADFKQLLRKLVFVLFSKINKIYARIIGLKTNRNQVSVFALWPRPKTLTEKHLALVLNKCHNHTEYMCHPALSAENMAGLTSIGTTSEQEYGLMTKKSFLDMIKLNNIKLINYGGL